MNNVTFVEDAYGVEHAIVDRGNGEYTSMTKETYEAQQAASTLPSNSVDPVEKPAK